MVDTCLLVACKRGDLEGVEQAIKDGADIHTKADGSFSPIMLAAERGHIQILEFLLAKGANPNDHSDRFTALMCVCAAVEPDECMLWKCLDSLLNAGSDPMARDHFGHTALIWAIKNNRKSLAWRLTRAGCPLNVPDSSGWTPIFLAVLAENLNMTQFLLDQGSKLNFVDKLGRTLTDIATMTGNEDLIQLVTTKEALEFTSSDSSVKRHCRFHCRQFRKLLADAPRKNQRLYGFHQEANKFLREVGVNTVETLMKTKNLQLGELLTWSDAEWKASGIHISYHRKFLRHCVSKYHERSWGWFAIPRPFTKVDDPFQLVPWLLDWLRVVHINSATSLFMLRNVPDGTPLRELQSLECSLRMISRVIAALKSPIMELEADARFAVPDLIAPQLTEGRPRSSSRTVKTAALCVVICGISLKYFFHLVAFVPKVHWVTNSMLAQFSAFKK